MEGYWPSSFPFFCVRFSSLQYTIPLPGVSSLTVLTLPFISPKAPLQLWRLPIYSTSNRFVQKYITWPVHPASILSTVEAWSRAASIPIKSWLSKMDRSQLTEGFVNLLLSKVTVIKMETEVISKVLYRLCDHRCLQAREEGESLGREKEHEKKT